MSRGRIVLLVGLVVAVLAAGGVLLVAGSDDAGDDAGAPPRSTTSTSARPGTTTAPEAPPSSTPDAPGVVWPARGSSTRFGSAAEAARSFAVDFLRFRDPVLGEARERESGVAEVDVRPRADGPVTTVSLVESGGAWWATAARTPDIEVTGPAAGAAVGSPLQVAGRALAFEGNVLVEVREAGSSAALGSGFVTGGGDELRPFSGSITFGPPAGSEGAVVFFTESAEDGRVWQATVVAVRFGG